MPNWYGGSTLNPDDVMPPQEQWRNQWARVLRWSERVRQIKQRSLNQELDLADFDIVLAFSQNCFHLRDWIAASRPNLKKQMDVLFRLHFEMGACRDVCNGFKHKTLNRPTHDKDFNLHREYDYFEAAGSGGHSPIKYRAVFADGPNIRKFDLFVLARTCVELWRDFLDENDLGNGRRAANQQPPLQTPTSGAPAAGAPIAPPSGAAGR